MSSLARRSLRTTAAVAGIAAVGLGLAAPAVAAPAPQDGPRSDGGAPSAPEAGSSPNVLGDLPSSDMPQLPKLASIEGPDIYTASRSLPTDEDMPLPTATDLVNLGAQEQLEGADVEYQAAAARGGDEAGDETVPDLGADAMVADLTSRALNSTEGNDVRA